MTAATLPNHWSGRGKSLMGGGGVAGGVMAGEGDGGCHIPTPLFTVLFRLCIFTVSKLFARIESLLIVFEVKSGKQELMLGRI